MTPPVPVGPFELTGVLGRGGMGEVWSGVHRELGEPVAVKVLTSNRARDPDFIDAFAGEVRAVAALDHPRVVRVHDYGRIPAGADEATEGQLVQGSPWLAMELVPGGSLSDHLARGWMSWGQQRGVLLGLLEALAHAHARGLVHRDLKPGNVLLGDPGRPGETLALADFGLAQAGEERELSGQTEQATGTPHFMAPEQFEGHWRDYGPWTDLYALGCVAFRMATGALPFVGESLYTVAFAHLTGARQAWEPRTPVPVGLEGWIDRLLRRAPGERFQRAADAAWALEQMDGGLEDRVGWPEGEPSVEAEEAPTIPSLRLASDTRMLSARTLVQEPTLPSGPPPPARPDERFTAYPPLPGHWKRPRGSRRTAGGLPGAGLGLFGLRRLPLVGRARELSLLWAALAEVRRTGEARVAVLRGGPGVGKSRLAESFAQRADEVGSAVVLHARHTREVDPGSGLGPMLSRLLQCRGLSEDDVRARASRLLESLGEPDPYEIDGLSEVMAPSSEGGDAGFAFGNPAERHRLMRRVLGRMAAGRPLVLRLDDVQHGGDALRFVRSALDAATDEPVPMLLVATLRDEELSGDEADLVAGLCRRPEVRELTLGPLHRDEQRRLVDSLLGLSSDLGDQVATRTAGNPLFAVQVVGDWVERGVLVATRRGFELAGGAEPALPDSVREVWAQRLATALQGAASDARSSLYVAAALGGQVDVRAEAHREVVELGLVVGPVDGVTVQGVVARRVERGGHPLGARVVAQVEGEEGAPGGDGLEPGGVLDQQGRLLAVADAFDAMTSKRVYREPIEPEEALRVVQTCSGDQFDPVMVEAFEAAYEAGSILSVLARSKDLESRQVLCPICSTYLGMKGGVATNDQLDCPVCDRRFRMTDEHQAVLDTIRPK